MKLFVEKTLCFDLPYDLNENNNNITTVIPTYNPFNWFFVQNHLQLKSYKSMKLLFWTRSPFFITKIIWLYYGHLQSKHDYWLKSLKQLLQIIILTDFLFKIIFS